jgi:hypothetical protein
VAFQIGEIVSGDARQSTILAGIVEQIDVLGVWRGRSLRSIVLYSPLPNRKMPHAARGPLRAASQVPVLLINAERLRLRQDDCDP